MATLLKYSSRHFFVFTSTTSAYCTVQYVTLNLLLYASICVYVHSHIRCVE